MFIKILVRYVFLTLYNREGERNVSESWTREIERRTKQHFADWGTKISVECRCSFCVSCVNVKSLLCEWRESLVWMKSTRHVPSATFSPKPLFLFFLPNIRSFHFVYTSLIKQQMSNRISIWFCFFYLCYRDEKKRRYLSWLGKVTKLLLADVSHNNTTCIYISSPSRHYINNNMILLIS